MSKANETIADIVAWLDWAASPDSRNSEGTVRMTVGEWLLAPFDGKGGDK